MHARTRLESSEDQGNLRTSLSTATFAEARVILNTSDKGHALHERADSAPQDNDGW